MTYETLIIQTDRRGVATLTLNRPKKHHALNSTMIEEMKKALTIFKDDHDIRVIVLASTGKSFCSGGDLAWMRDQATNDRSGKIREAKNLTNLLSLIYTMPKPVIAKVQGNAYGGGVGLMAVADIVIATNGAKFAFTETRLGLIPAIIGPFVIRKLGGGVARSVFITGSLMDTARAERLGLVSIKVSKDELDTATEKEIGFALNAAPKAMGLAKRLNLEWSGDLLNDQSRVAIESLADCWETDETRDGIKAFFENQPAPWVK